MRTTIDLAAKVLRLITTPEVKAAIGGDIYLQQRPTDSRNEDIVVNTLPITGSDLQQAIVNVNIHVPNVSVSINGKPDNDQPNMSKLQAICDAVIPLLVDAYTDDISISIQQQSLLSEPQFKEHFVNIRLQIYSPNI